MTAQDIDMALLEKAVRNLPGDALAAIRRDALERFAETGFPHTWQEDWKYTNLAPAVQLSNEWLRRSDAGPGSQRIDSPHRQLVESNAANIDAHWIPIVNGSLDTDSLQELVVADVPGLEARSSSTAGDAQPLSTEEPMSRFNAALLRDVLRVRITAGRTIERPIGFLLIDDAASATNVSQTRIVIELSENARASFIERHISVGERGQFANGVTELRLARAARADYVRIQERDAGHFQVGRLQATLSRDAVLNHAAFDFGGALIRNDLAVDIVEPGAAVRLHGLYLANGSQHIDNHTRIDHRVGPAKSVEDYRGVLSDRARCVFNGKAIVHAGADGSDAHQSNRNLLLSEKAEIDTKPELEIHADDVKCSHGATVGQLDPVALFYLQSRGLSRPDAARLLTRAFAAASVDHIPVAAARSYVEAAIDRKLADLIEGTHR